MRYNLIGWTIIALICIVPIFLLLYYGPAYTSSYFDVTHRIGQIAGLLAITLFSLTFILSTRIRFIEDIFGGLDKVYKVHSILGGSALILILFHPIFLVLKFIPSDITLAATYLLPSSYWSVNFGIIAFIGLAGLLFFTFYTKIKYNHWKVSHKFLGLVFIFAVLHIFLVRGVASRDSIFPGYYIYAAIISAIGLVAFFYSLLFKGKTQSSFYKIEKIRRKDDVHEITLVPEKKPLKYKSGQFVFLRFYNERLTKESHPFSIASKSNDPKIRVIIKNLGDFTSKTHELKVGGRVAVEGPYGRFNHFKNNKDMIWIAGGIGITPFIGMSKDLRDEKVDLYYSVKEEEDLISLEYLKSIDSLNKNFRVIPWVTSKKGWLNVKNIKEISKNLGKRDFYLCGPVSMKEMLTKQLIRNGVKKNNIHQEDFNLK